MKMNLIHRLSTGFALCFVFVLPGTAAAWNVTSVGCPNMSVRSLDRSVAFYTSALRFQLANSYDSTATARLQPGMPSTVTARTARLGLGDECLELTEYSGPPGRSFPADSRGNDHWFQHVAIVVSDIARAYTQLRELKVVSVSDLPQTLPVTNREAAGISAFYFRDPDGHYLELIHFPKGKGQTKWQLPSSSLFLGIDHTAIVISNTAASLKFYQDQLGFHITGSSDNVGLEQEHLSGVFNAHVAITSLRADSGIGIELLEYVTPAGGRPIPADQQPTDLESWMTPIRLGKSDGSTSQSLLSAPAWKLLPTKDKGEAAWLTDPDGHTLELLK